MNSKDYCPRWSVMGCTDNHKIGCFDERGYSTELSIRKINIMNGRPKEGIWQNINTTGSSNTHGDRALIVSVMGNTMRWGSNATKIDFGVRYYNTADECAKDKEPNVIKALKSLHNRFSSDPKLIIYNSD